MSTTNVHPGWTQLLGWLAEEGANIEDIPVEPSLIHGAGYGLIARRDLQPASKILRIPAKALPNKLTLSPLYPRTARKLSAVQLVSLHLYLNCPLDTENFSADVPFGKYISILPRDFSFHPVTWLCDRDITEDYNDLLKNLSPGVANKLNQRADRVLSDWAVVREYLQANTSIHVNTNISRYLATNPIAVDKNFIWAWLIVNTRCIYCRLNDLQSHEDNLTLGPIVDFANHQITSNSVKVDFSKQLGGDLILSLPKGYSASAGDELYLTYGHHPNSTLFVEYGFVDRTRLDSNEDKEVDITSTVTQLFDKRGDLGLEFRNILKNRSYWGDWTVHSSSELAYPSYRLITALRLYHLVDPSTTKIPVDLGTRLEVWEDTISGKRSSVSEENEVTWKGTLFEICQEVVADAKLRAARLVEAERKLGTICSQSSITDLKALCEEEVVVCSSVCQSIKDGVEF